MDARLKGEIWFWGVRVSKTTGQARVGRCNAKQQGKVRGLALGMAFSDYCMRILET